MSEKSKSNVRLLTLNLRIRRRGTRASTVLSTLVALMTLAAVSVSAQTRLIEQSRAAIDRGDSDTAIAIMEKAVAQYPNSAEAHFALFTAYGSKAQKVGLLGAAKY